MEASQVVFQVDETSGEQMIHCHFCGESEGGKPKELISHKGIAICNDCVGVCVKVIQESRKPKWPIHFFKKPSNN